MLVSFRTDGDSSLGEGINSRRKSVKRTTEGVDLWRLPFSRPRHGLRFTSLRIRPSSKLLSYYHSSATRTPRFTPSQSLFAG